MEIFYMTPQNEPFLIYDDFSLFSHNKGQFYMYPLSEVQNFYKDFISLYDPEFFICFEV